MTYSETKCPSKCPTTLKKKRSPRCCQGQATLFYTFETVFQYCFTTCCVTVPAVFLKLFEDRARRARQALQPLGTCVIFLLLRAVGSVLFGENRHVPTYGVLETMREKTLVMGSRHGVSVDESIEVLILQSKTSQMVRS